MTPDITRTSIDERNIYDGHHDIIFHYRHNERLMAITHATGYPHLNEYDHISTLRPHHAGKFSTGSLTATFKTLDEMDEFIVNEIQNGTILPYK